MTNKEAALALEAETLAFEARMAKLAERRKARQLVYHWIYSIGSGVLAGYLARLLLLETFFRLLLVVPENVCLILPSELDAFLTSLPPELQTPDFSIVVTVVQQLPHLGQAFVAGLVAAHLGPWCPPPGGIRLRDWIHWFPRLCGLAGGLASLATGVMGLMLFRGSFWMIVEFPIFLFIALLGGEAELHRRRQNPYFYYEVDGR
jgi:hypothetical protein